MFKLRAPYLDVVFNFYILIIGVFLLVGCSGVGSPSEPRAETSSPAPRLPTSTKKPTQLLPTSTHAVPKPILPTSGTVVRVVTVSADQLKTPAGIAQAIQQNFPEVEKIELILTPQPFKGDLVIILDENDQKNVVFQRGEGDCAAGCISMYYWYFTVFGDGRIALIDTFQRVYDSKTNAYVENGTPHWEYPR